MPTTNIHLTKKLEKLVKKLVSKDAKASDALPGDWNATVFYVDRKKCWLITNAVTKYNVVLTDIKASDLKNIEHLFKNAFYGQLVYDGIIIDFETINAAIGSLQFLPTNNDRSTLGFQNHSLEALDWWKYQYGGLEGMAIKELTHRLNTSPFHKGGRRGMNNYTDAIKEMKVLLLGWFISNVILKL